jgi:hypothetical protein
MRTTLPANAPSPAFSLILFGFLTGGFVGDVLRLPGGL